MTPFYRREEIEWLAWSALRRLETLLGKPTALPIDVDAVGERLLGLSWLYEPIPEPPGVTILAALCPAQRLVVLNETHDAMFGRNEGLERFTKAHELGHWVCHVAGRRDEAAHSARCKAHSSDRAQPHREPCAVSREPPFPSRLDHEWQEKQANWFAAALLMPPLPLRRAADEIGVLDWRGRYALKERCGVSISALNVRLRQLGYPDLRE